MKGWGLWVQVSRRRINIDLGHCRRQPWAIIDSLSAVVVVVISNLMIVTIVVARSLRSGQRCRSRSGRVSSLSWVIFLRLLRGRRKHGRCGRCNLMIMN